MTEAQRNEWIKSQAVSRGKIHTFDEPARSNKPPSRRDKHRAEVAERKLQSRCKP